MKTYHVTVDSDKTIRWYDNPGGNLHREDGPAVEYASGTKHWYQHGKLHREDGPALEGADGDKLWYLNGNLHREDGPALEYADGTKYWYLNGKLLTEKGFLAKQKQKQKHMQKQDSCDGKMVEIEGKKYRLVLEVDN